ncbi:NADPH dehydrogenase NamA [Lottiidibacillus patelloidae]|uniref:NADPH dehydrogenase NamA n=1 Tax=Lottiidibacillus patelloidae TaxID=2670334 RepID=A0A263BYC1_9BACI|nr:NADPH dehydrogenase NamA [Lottiidibacillus patelloidae]OZM58670.1 NADPH dehydrogenase NamA [Lottiidibacillus patelloidae]
MSNNTALFSPITINGVTLKNRIVMSPMCMYSCLEQDGKVTSFHKTHYISRAVGQVGLICLEATAVSTEGRISEEDLGIWNDEHVTGLKELVHGIHEAGSKAAIQLAHAGRKAMVKEDIIAPTAEPHKEGMKVPVAMSEEQIKKTINDFKEGARRAKEAGFDIIELHGAHGYLINEFLSPLINTRQDQYGGNMENRYRFLKEIITSVKEVWDGPLFVRISASDYHEQGNNADTYVSVAQWMKEQGVDLVDCSSGGVIQVKLQQKINVFPGYQVAFADKIRNEAHIATGAVGMITSGLQAEEIIQNNRADLVFIGRELLRDPYWPRTAAKELNATIESPQQYNRAW